MPNRYARAAMTYAQRWMFRVIFAVLVAVWALIAIQLPPNPSDTHVALFAVVLTIFGMWFGGAIAVHLLEQLADWRAALVPKFRAPHLLAAGAAVLLAGVALPAAASLRLHASPLALVALVLTAVVSTAVGVVYSRLPVVGAIYIAGWACLCVPQIHSRVGGALLGGGRAVIPTAILLLNAAASALVALRLATLRGETSESYRPAPFSWRLRPATTGDASTRYAAPPRAGPLDRLLRRRDRFPGPLPNVASASLFSRVRHWRHVTLSGWRPAALGLGMTLIATLVFVAYLLEQLQAGDTFDHARRAYLPQSSVALLFAPVVGPACVCALLWPRRWFTLPDEVLRPVSRRRFFTEMGLALAADLLAVWFWCAVSAVALVCALLYISGAGDVATGHLTVAGDVAAFLGWSVVTQTFAFALIVTTLRWRSGVISLLTVPAAALSFLAPVAVALLAGLLARAVSDALGYYRLPRAGSEWSDVISGFLLPAALTLAIALSLLHRAHRKWRRMQLG